MLAEVAGEDMAAMSKARVPRRQQQADQQQQQQAAEEEPSEAEQDLAARLNAVRS